MFRREKNTIADKVISVIGESSVFTLYGGYCVKDGNKISFPKGHLEFEKRNERGQVLIARMRYADNSILIYTRKPDNQFVLSAKIN